MPVVITSAKYPVQIPDHCPQRRPPRSHAHHAFPGRARAVHRIHAATALAGRPAVSMTVTSGPLPGGRVLTGIPAQLLSFYKSI
jgi:hypothetical protein